MQSQTAIQRVKSPSPQCSHSGKAVLSREDTSGKEEERHRELERKVYTLRMCSEVEVEEQNETTLRSGPGREMTQRSSGCGRGAGCRTLKISIPSPPNPNLSRKGRCGKRHSRSKPRLENFEEKPGEKGAKKAGVKGKCERNVAADR